MRLKKLSHLLGSHIQKEEGTDDMVRPWGPGSVLFWLGRGEVKKQRSEGRR